LQNTFEVVAREWHTNQSYKWTEDYAGRVLTRLVNDIFPLIGSKPIKTVTGKDILEALRKIEDRGSIETAHRVKQFISQIFRYAQPTGRAENDPAANLNNQLKPVKHGSFAVLQTPKR